MKTITSIFPHVTLGTALKLLCALYLIVMMLHIAPATAQQSKPLAAGDRVLVTAKLIPVYVKPDKNSVVVEELIAGINSRVLKVQQDEAGQTWIYLSDNAYGWVQVPANSSPALTLYSEQAVRKMIDDATDTIKNDPKNVDAFMARATAYATQLKLKMALVDYDAAIAIAPQEGLIHDYRGKLNLRLFDYNQTIVDINKAIERGRKLANTYNRLAIAYQNLSKNDDALTYYGQAISIAPDYGLLYSNRGNAIANQGKMQQAIQQYSEAIKRDPYLATGYSNRAWAYHQLRNNDAALNDYNKALEIDPYCSSCYLNRGVLYSDYDPQAAFDDFNKAIENDPTNTRAYTNRGVSYIKRGRSDLALPDLKKAVELNPNDDYAQYNLGTLYGYLGDYQNALNSYTKAIDLDKQYATSARLYRSQIYLALSRYDEAVTDTSEYLGAVNDTPQNAAFIATAYITRGAAYLHKGHYRAAVMDFQVAFDTNNGFARNYASSGRGYRVAPLREAEIPNWESKVKGDPNNADLLLQLANRYMECGYWQPALDSYNRYLALKKDPLIVELVSQIAELIK